MHLHHPIAKARRLRELLDKRTVVLPGAFNALTAMQIERAGFQALYVSGAGLSATRGLPDIGLLSLTEVVSDAATITKAVAIPAIVDADTGFGPLSRSCVPCRNSSRPGWQGCRSKIKCCPKSAGIFRESNWFRRARWSARFVRQTTHDEILISSLSRVRMRAPLRDWRRQCDGHRAYIDAGADAIFPEALESADEFRLFARQLAKEGVESDRWSPT